MPLYDQALFERILGSVMSLANVAALGANETTYLAKFDEYGDDNWDLVHHDGLPSYDVITYPDRGGISEGVVNYYGRDHMNYMWYAMSGYTNSTYLDRANALCRQYIDTFLVPRFGGSSPSGDTQPNREYMKGVSLYYATTGYSTALDMIGRVADLMTPWWVYGSGLSAGTTPYTRLGEPNPGSASLSVAGSYSDGRINARILEFVTLAHICGAPSGAGFNWSTVADDAANFILTRRGPYNDGQWRFAESSGGVVNNPNYYVYPWQLAMIWNALMFYYRVKNQDSRIPAAIAASIQQTVDAGIWLPFPTVGINGKTRGWKYNEHPITGEGDETVYPSLNGFFLPGIAFAYNKTGNTSFSNLAREAFIGLVGEFNPSSGISWNTTPATAQKQYNQGFWEGAVQFPLLHDAALSGRPGGDISTGSWRNETGGTTLFSSIDETTADNTDYIRSGNNPTNDICEISLTSPVGGIINGPIKYRYGKKNNNTVVVNLRVRLMQGATEIAAWNHVNIPFTPVDATQFLTAPQFAAITDPSNLRLQFIANPTG